jgi:hypothetical protein
MFLPQDPTHGLPHDGTHGSTIATSRGDRRALSTFPRTATELAREFLELAGELMMITWKDHGDNSWNNSITMRDCTICGNGLYTTTNVLDDPPPQPANAGAGGHLPRTVIPTIFDPLLDGHTQDTRLWW